MSTQSTFEQDLAFGKIAESQIATWLRRVHGWDFLPVYDIEKHTGKGPQVFTTEDALIAPDILAMKRDGGQWKLRWIEAKRKTAFSWHRQSRRWVTGIDLKHYRDYQAIAERYPWELWLLFLHESSMPSNEDRSHSCPSRCPTGLFGEEIGKMSRHENHRSDKYGKGGMVYWKHQSLRQLATLNEIRNTSRLQ